MAENSMNMKVLLPNQVFLETSEVLGMVVETFAGAYGILPDRLDCIAALVPGILTYAESSGTEKYIAIDIGILVKTGKEVTISVRNAITGMSLGLLHEAADKQFLQLDIEEKELQSTLTKLESGFIQQMRKLKHD